MSLAQKGARRIIVNGDAYRWRVAPNDEPGLGIVVHNAASAAQRMVTWVEHGNTISPWLVRHAILNALKHGWHPHEKGPELIFRIEGILNKDEPRA